MTYVSQNRGGGEWLRTAKAVRFRFQSEAMWAYDGRLMRITLSTLAFATLGAVLLLAGCGDSDDGGSNQTAARAAVLSLLLED